MYKRYVGMHVLVRSRNEGLNFGEVIEYDSTGIILKNARRLWHHVPAGGVESWYEGVALNGLSEGSGISISVPTKMIVEVYSITECSPEAVRSIIQMPSHKQT